VTGQWSKIARDFDPISPCNGGGLQELMGTDEKFKVLLVEQSWATILERLL